MGLKHFYWIVKPSYFSHEFVENTNNDFYCTLPASQVFRNLVGQYQISVKSIRLPINKKSHSSVVHLVLHNSGSNPFPLSFMGEFKIIPAICSIVLKQGEETVLNFGSSELFYFTLQTGQEALHMKFIDENGALVIFDTEPTIVFSIKTSDDDDDGGQT
jgi:hypothetical protein